MIDQLFSGAGLPLGSPAFFIALLLFAGALVCGLQWRRALKRTERIRRELEKTRIALAGAEARASESENLRSEWDAERVRRESLETELAARTAVLAERERSLVELRARLDAEFKAATAEMLDGAQKAFFSRTKETFERFTENADVEGERRRKALDELLRPVSETLVRYEKGLTELRAEQHKSRGELAAQIGDLSKSTLDVRMEAQKLATALRAGPKTRGRWGEEQLRNVVEIAGMTAYVDFVEQTSHDDNGRRKQPDMVVRLPGGRVIAVDSKVSLGAYLDAVEADNDDARAASLSRHADALWTHVKALSAKGYATSLSDALDYVVMFVPGENYFSAAMEARPQLYQDAFDRKILIATPTILIAMLKSAALNWRQEKMTANAQAVAGMAKDLYDSLRRMGENLSGLGKSIEGAVKKYNDLVANVEGRVMPRARKFAEYELPGVDVEIGEVTVVETAPRALRGDKDLLLPPMHDADIVGEDIALKKDDAA